MNRDERPVWLLFLGRASTDCSSWPLTTLLSPLPESFPEQCHKAPNPGGLCWGRAFVATQWPPCLPSEENEANEGEKTEQWGSFDKDASQLGAPGHEGSFFCLLE